MSAVEQYGGVVYAYDVNVPLHSAQSERVGWLHHVKRAFLPHGYPDSVSDDYLEYQIWDTAQAFCSSITNILSNHALLRGYGVGDAEATAAAALMTWMLRDGSAMVGRIVFAGMYGTRLDCNSKSWRLFADILNDMAICVEIAAPLTPFFVELACMGSLGKAIVSVAGGATRAALTQHQARRNNLADVSAKDGSQEQVVQLTAMLVGLLVTPYLETHPLYTWGTFVLLTCLHLYCNYRAVTCVVFHTFNRERANIVMDHYLRDGSVLSPQLVAQREPLFWSPRSARHDNIHLGVRLAELAVDGHARPRELLRQSAPYHISLTQTGHVLIALNKDIEQAGVLEAYLHALLLTHLCHWEGDHAPQLSRTDTAKWKEMQKHFSARHLTAAVDCSYSLAQSLLPKLRAYLIEREWVVEYALLGADDWRVAIKTKGD